MPESDLVLLAIDNEEIIPLFEHSLNAVQYKVAIARDLPALDRALQESMPALVIICQGFNGADEIEIAADVLERFPILPVLLVLPRVPESDLKKAMRIGVSDCLYLPLNPDEIIKTVENCLKRAGRIGDWTRREQKRTIASLQQRVNELKKLESVIENINEGVILLDPELNLLLINPAARKTFGIWQEDEAKGKPLDDVIHHPDLKMLLVGNPANPLSQNELTFEDGRVLLAQCITIPRVGVVITLQDITYLKQIDRLKNEFVYTVSHDLRSPLTAILGYVDLLDRVGSVNDQQRDFIIRVQNSVQSITVLVNDLLELGRIEAGLDSQKEVLQLGDIIHSILEISGGQITEKKLVVHLNLPVDIPCIFGNPIRMRQLLDNLIGNAIKYTPIGGMITFDLDVQNDQIILRVSDTGPGIPPADQPHIFEKFYRASNVPKGVEGSGLGLAIVKTIVENHQGRIWVESQLGQGTTFTVVMPIDKRAGS